MKPVDDSSFNLIEIGNVNEVEEEIENDEDVNVTDYYGNTPLHEAVKKGYSIILWMISTKRNSYWDILYENKSFFRLGREAVVEILIQNDADINLKNVYGQTPIDIAEENGKEYWLDSKIISIKGKSIFERHGQFFRQRENTRDASRKRRRRWRDGRAMNDGSTDLGIFLNFNLE